MATIRRRKDGGYLLTVTWKGHKYDKQIEILKQKEESGDATALIMEAIRIHSQNIITPVLATPEEITIPPKSMSRETKEKLKGRFSV